MSINAIILYLMKNKRKEGKGKGMGSICRWLLSVELIHHHLHLEQHMKKTEILSQFSIGISFSQP